MKGAAATFREDLSDGRSLICWDCFFSSFCTFFLFDLCYFSSFSDGEGGGGEKVWEKRSEGARERVAGYAL